MTRAFYLFLTTACLYLTSMVFATSYDIIGYVYLLHLAEIC